MTMTRREVVGRMTVVVGAGAILPGCKFLDIFCSESWVKAARKWWELRRKDLSGPEGARIPRPYLEYRIADRANLFGPLRRWAPNQRGEITVTVHNRGNVPSWLCYVAAYTSNAVPGQRQVMGTTRVACTRISLMPGETRAVRLGLALNNPAREKITIRCWDPILDPVPHLANTVNRQTL